MIVTSSHFEKTAVCSHKQATERSEKSSNIYIEVPWSQLQEVAVALRAKISLEK